VRTRFFSHIDCLKIKKLGLIQTLTVVVSTSLLVGVARPQSSPCTGTPPPTETSHPIFKAGANVFVMYDSSLSQTESDHSKAGFQSWNAANAQNGSGVHFQDQDPNADVSVLVRNGTLASSTVSGESFSAGPDGTIQTMTIIFNTIIATQSSHLCFSGKTQITTEFQRLTSFTRCRTLISNQFP